MALISLRRRGEDPDQLLARTQELAQHVDSEHVALEELIVKSRLAAAELSRLTEPIAEMNERLDLFEKRLKHVGEVAARVAEVQDRTVRLDQAQHRMEAQIATAVESTTRVQAELGDIRPLLENALRLKDEVAKFLTLEGPFKPLRAEASTLKAKVTEVADDCVRLRQRQDELAAASKRSPGSSRRSRRRDRPPAARSTPRTAACASSTRTSFASPS
jgi:chromosome segregation ATPase